jgi:hypothetical protein
VCALEQDMVMLPAGAETEIGEKVTRICTCADSCAARPCTSRVLHVPVKSQVEFITLTRHQAWRARASVSHEQYRSPELNAQASGTSLQCQHIAKQCPGTLLHSISIHGVTQME